MSVVEGIEQAAHLIAVPDITALEFRERHVSTVDVIQYRRNFHGVPCTISPNRKIFEARKRETAALGAGEKLVLGHPLAATIGDSARCMQNLEKVLFTGPKTSDTVTFICD